MATERLPQETIRNKRDGAALDPDAIDGFVRGIADGSIGDAQIGAFAMAVVLNGMTAAETVALTLAMRDSGTILRWDDLPGPVLDKHSTGGVGDKVSLVLAPLLAACGAYVPMLSGRGLGHTGGTLDKLEAIPGYTTRVGLDRLREVVREAGCAIVGASAELAPADRRLYAIRDVTATVESVPLITASILAKKLAGGAQALVMDIKVGSGAFLPTLADARELARSIVTVARGAGLACTALLTDMSRCLGTTAGNALEVLEAIGLLRDETGDARLREATLALAAEALVAGKLAADVATARLTAERALASGAAAERFNSMVRALSGPNDLLEHPCRHLHAAPVQMPVHPLSSGTVSTVDARKLGLAVITLSGGRRRIDDMIDPSVGLAQLAGPGDEVGPERALCVLHAQDDDTAAGAASMVQAAFHVDGEPAAALPVTLDRIA